MTFCLSCLNRQIRTQRRLVNDLVQRRLHVSAANRASPAPQPFTQWQPAFAPQNPFDTPFRSTSTATRQQYQEEPGVVDEYPVERYELPSPPPAPKPTYDPDLPPDDWLEEQFSRRVEVPEDEIKDIFPKASSSPRITPELIDRLRTQQAQTQQSSGSVKVERPKRRKEVSNLPRIPPDQAAPSEFRRWDWRSRAINKFGRADGDAWYPEMKYKRVKAEMTKLTWGDKYRDELERYTAHFEPLLNAEFEDARRIYNTRLREWPLRRLIKEGYTLPKLTATKSHFLTSTGTTPIEFRKLDKDGKAIPLPFNQFNTGQNVVLSRTNPLTDAVGADGISLTSINEPNFLTGHVYSSFRNYVRVIFDAEVPDITDGQWRLDVGMNDWHHKTQLRAIQSMNLNPNHQEVYHLLRQMQEADEASEDEYYSNLDSQEGFVADDEQVILEGTGLRDNILHAFQEDFVPYASIASILPTAESGPDGPISTVLVDDGVVQPQRELEASEIDAVPTVTHAHQTSTGLLKDNQLIQSWAKRHRVEGTVVRSDGDPDVPLNASQIRAMAMMLSERLSLVQGPPGTGKTRVIIETLKLLKLHWQIPQPILVTAHTNVAVDNLLSGLRAKGVKALRWGPVERVRPDLLEYQFDAVAREHPLYSEIDSLMAEKENLWAKTADGRYRQDPKSNMGRKAELTRRIYGLRAKMITDILTDADVICTTCLSAASTSLKHIDFPMVFLDEASMATEPLSLVPLMKGSSHVAIIGDHKQLPPVILSEEARFGGLATSLFERLIHEKQVPSVMLDTQYRMHPDISSFPSKAFYNDSLKNGTITSSGQAIPSLAPPETSYLCDEAGNLRNVMFVDHNHPESFESRSKSNHGDAEKVADIIVDILYNNPDLAGSDIGIITPYAAQIRLLHSYLNSDARRTAAIADVLGPERATEVGDIEIKTVDGFEGREKEVIVFSTVRSNDKGYIGFLADWRRLNVGITRAKRGLIIVGSAETLEKARIGTAAEDHLPSGGTDVWKEFITHLRDSKQIIKV